MYNQSPNFKTIVTESLKLTNDIVSNYHHQLEKEEIGKITYLGDGIAKVQGLPSVEFEELVKLPGEKLAMVFNLDIESVGLILLDKSENIKAGCQVQRTGKVLETPVGEGLLGRVVDGMGRPLDDGGAISAKEWRPIEKPAPKIMERAAVTAPLQTGIKVIDALIPIGKGQRELILGDRQTGKTAIALDTILNQKGKNVICIYCAIGQRSSAVAKIIAQLKSRDALSYSIVVVALGDSTPGLQYITPYAATTMAEYFMEKGKDVLIVYDDLIQHARAYRELSLLLRRPPGREAFPGDIFYIHSRLLERATHLRPELGGGSLTALPIIETEAQNLAAYIPTNLISITDGQIYLTPNLFQKGILPAIDVGKSVSRVGGKTQLPAYREVAGALRLSYAQFEELEAFSRFDTRLDTKTRQTLERGHRVREVLKQSCYQPISVAEQIIVLYAVTQGIFDSLPLEKIALAERIIRQTTQDKLSDICQSIERGKTLTDADLKHIYHTLSLCHL